MPRRRPPSPPTVLIGDAALSLTDRLGKRLDSLASLKNLTPDQRLNLARELTPAIQYAAIGTPSIWTTGSCTPQPRGRPRNVVQDILVSDVKRALTKCGLPATRWHTDGRGSLLHELGAICWEVATGEPAQNDAGDLRDLRRSSEPTRSWHNVPEGKK